MGIFVGGVEAGQVAAHSRPTYETLADGGCGSASWEWNLPKTYGGQATTRGALVRIVDFGKTVYLGRLETIADGAVTCRGLWSDGQTIAALDGSGNATRDVGVAIANAAARWGITNRHGISGTVYGDTGEPMMMVDLLRQYAAQQGRYVGVDADGDLYSRVDATAPMWLIAAGDVDLGGSDATTYTRLIGRHRDMTGAFVTSYSASAPPPVVEAIVDLTGRTGDKDWGRMTSLDATALLTRLRDRMLGPTWTEPLTLHQSQIRTLGGGPAPLGSVRGGDRARIHSLTASQQAKYGAPYIDVTLGSVARTIGEPMIEVAPVGTEPVTLEDAMAAVA